MFPPCPNHVDSLCKRVSSRLERNVSKCDKHVQGVQNYCFCQLTYFYSRRRKLPIHCSVFQALRLWRTSKKSSGVSTKTGAKYKCELTSRKLLLFCLPEETSFASRQELLARLPSLTSLNGSSVSERNNMLFVKSLVFDISSQKKRTDKDKICVFEFFPHRMHTILCHAVLSISLLSNSAFPCLTMETATLSLF